MRRLLASVAAATTLGAMAALAESPPVPVLDWQPCPAAPDGAATTDGLDCASAEVPFDHADPSAGIITLALIRAPARDQGARIGSLFWNPGGPSDAGTAYLPPALAGFPARVRDRFDIVSWDPRGMGGRSVPVVQCFDSAAAEAAFLSEHLAGSVPVTPDEFAADAAGRAALNAACVARAGDLLAHVSTADNARDLDLLRQAVGEATLSYYGTSYGTFLGATYLNMFPDRVRGAVLDGAVAPSAWAGGPEDDAALSTFLRVGSDFGARDTIRAFLDQCGGAGTPGCAFAAETPEATRAKWTELLRRADAGIDLDGQPLSGRDVLSYVGGSIYILEPVPGFDRFPGWVAVAEFLEAAWQASDTPKTSPAPADPAASPMPGAAAYLTSVGRQLSVVCGESPNPGTVAAITAQAQASYARAGISAWPFVASCGGWSARAAAPYLGPWNTPTPVPVLVIGNTYDPATPLASSVRMAQELADGRLLVVHGFGHTVLLNPSTCAQEYIADYLIDGTPPPEGASCAQDKPPFPGG